MNIVIFGANGVTGRLLTQQAVESGYAVTAVTRHPKEFPLQHERLHLARGDVFDLASVEHAIAGQDAVLSTLGVPYSRKPITVYSHGMANIIRAMQHTGVRRLVCVSSSAAGEDHETDGGFLFDNVLQPLIMSTIGRTTYADMRRMEKVVMKSHLDWTIVRPSGLFNLSAVTDYHVAEAHIRARFTSRADLADCMLQQLTTDRFLRKIVAVATTAVRPSVVSLVLKEAFKKPTAA